MVNYGIATNTYLLDFMNGSTLHVRYVSNFFLIVKIYVFIYKDKLFHIFFIADV